jgi:hypothetical protein
VKQVRPSVAGQVSLDGLALDGFVPEAF